MPTRFRGVLLLALLLLPAAGLVAFGPRGRGAAPTDRVILRYWDKWTGVEGAAVQKLVDQYNDTIGAEHGVWVDYVALGDVDKRMLIAAAGGDPPDMAGLYDRFVPPYADQGALAPLDELASEFGVDLAAFKPIWLDICRYDGQLFALPSTPYTIALYYNRRLFREAGLDPDRPPQTTAELNEYAARLTRRAGQSSGLTPAGHANQPVGQVSNQPSGKLTQLGFTTSPAMLGWWHWVWPYFFGGELWDGREFTLDTPATHAAMQWIVERRQAAGNDATLQFEATAGAIESAQNPFLSEKLAMVYQGPWLANWARVYAPNLDYGVARFPGYRADFQPVFASADVFVIPTGSQRPREAMRFLAYMLRQDVLETLCRAHGKVSPFREPSAEFFATHPNAHIRVFDALAASPDAFGYPKMPTFSEAWTEMLYCLETVLRAARPPAEAIRITQDKVGSVVAEYERMRARRIAR